ncbi:MAG: hypothetical protein ACI3Z8_04260 [Paludibacteraceae bacterium]
MKEVVFALPALLQLEESVAQLVEKNYFSSEDYAVEYVRDIFQFFSLNLPNLIAYRASAYFDRYKIDNKQLYYIKYNKNSHTTWYAFFEDLENVHSIVYLGNNHLIGHRLDIRL